jgi:hypothetical protein
LIIVLSMRAAESTFCVRLISGADDVVWKQAQSVKWFFGWCCTLAVSMALVGCGAPGEGTIKVDPGAREKMAGPAPGAAGKALTAKQAKTKGVIEEAVKKNPKLQ